MDHSYEEIRNCVLNVLADRESAQYGFSQYAGLHATVAEVFMRRENPKQSRCLLSSSEMLGVATEHSSLKLLETVETNANHSATYQNAFCQCTILQKFNKFSN